MSGTGAPRGPIPKRSAERVRVDDSGMAMRTIDISKLIQQEVEIPEPDEKWHKIAKMTWESLRTSAQAVYYEPSDWMIAYAMCEDMSRNLKPQYVGFDETNGMAIIKKIPMKGASLTAYAKIQAALLMTEGDRRRLRVEVEREIHAGAENTEQTPDQLAERRRNRAQGA